MIEELRVGSLVCRVISPVAEVQAAVVLLHGYAMDIDDLAPLAVAMRLPAALYFPRGPLEAIPHGRSWWPIDEERRRAQLERGPRDLSDEYPPLRYITRADLNGLLVEIRQRHRNLPVFLAGFSQGGMLACDTILHEAPQIAGLILMSASRIAMEEWDSRIHRACNLPVLISHGRSDQDLSIQAGERLRDTLAAAGAHVSWLPFDGGHEIPLIVWRQFKRLVMQNLPSITNHSVK